MRVQTSSNYDAFKILAGNRIIRPSHVARIKKSMQECFIPVPIIVNEHKFIIDGQHRAEACKELKIPFKFIQIEGLGLKDVQRLNSDSKSWSLDDYMESYCNLGKPSYETYKSFKQRFKFQHEPNFVMLKDYAANSDIWRKDFRDGVFTINDKELEFATKSAYKIKQMSKFFEKPVYGTRKSFVRACVIAFRKKEYDHKQMIHKLTISKRELKDHHNRQDCTRMLEDVYFYKVREQDHFRLD